MSIPTSLSPLLGTWSGTSRLFLPGEPERASGMTAKVSPVVDFQFLQLAYTWWYRPNLAEEALEPQEGLLLIGETQTLFADSWHMGSTFMVCTQTQPIEEGFSVFGTYRVPGHPDWGWRTVIAPGSDSFRVSMYNVPPEGQGEEELGFECIFTRV